jgi:hypothetical protein
MDNPFHGILMGMDFLRRNLKRILTDAAGYALILAGIATGWLPGPGGIPLVVGGLGLLSINNTWAKRLRVFVLDHAGKAADILFPKNPWIEWAYDVLVVILFALTVYLEVHHASIFLMGLGVSAFCIALLIALTNRDRLNRLRGKHKQ